MSASPPHKGLLEAALAYAARGWPVFPCSPRDKAPLLPADKDAAGKRIPGSGGCRKASLDPEQIRAWWSKWPSAMIGVAMGDNGLFALDFDPRIDADTGEEWTLDRLKAELEQQIGGALPASLAVRTPSGGVHVYFAQPATGDPIRNRGNLPRHVDVRGEGGYVIAPPSCMEDGRRYRWLRDDAAVPIADAPAALITILQSRKGASPTTGKPKGKGVGRRTMPNDVTRFPRSMANAARSGRPRAVRDRTRSIAAPSPSRNWSRPALWPSRWRATRS